jgi:D-alanine-D-alanine ligase-like ATP-grasp enzyme
MSEFGFCAYSATHARYSTLIKKKTQFSSYARHKASRREQLQSNTRRTASSYMRKIVFSFFISVEIREKAWVY